MGRVEERQRRKKKRSKKRLYIILIVLLIALAGVIYYVYESMQAAGESYNDLDGREKSDLREESVALGKDPSSILVMGVENYEDPNSRGRTDTMMVLTFNPKDNSVKMVSLPRDTRVEIAERGTMDKINHAYAFGGTEMAIHTVENFLDIPIDYYAEIDFDAFVNIVDLVGGVTVTVPFDFEEKTMHPGSRWVEFKEGEQHVSGEEALAFVRMRKQDPRGDIGRNARQQELLKSLVDEAVKLRNVTKIDDLGRVIGENVTTNVKVSDGLSLFMNMKSFSSDNLESISYDTNPQWINGGSYEIPVQESVEEVRNALKKHLELSSDGTSKTPGNEVDQAS
uniref:LCP family protein n=1 Tax=uncultured Allobacillus sp. TaxID=1638025 RepID=UPI002598F87E|nr:LCP family protein [uncultured Allobacillus sp.]